MTSRLRCPLVEPSEAAEETAIHFERRPDGIALITFDRAQTKNGMTPGCWSQFSDYLVSVASSSNDRVLVLQGAGGNFSSGGEMRSRREGDPPHPPLAMMHAVNRTCELLRNLPKPTIAAVEGVAVGAGFNIALACDLAVAGSSARFSQIFVKRGLSPDFGGSWLLTHNLGLQRAKELAFFGDILSATEIHDLGLVNRVVADGTAKEFALEWAARLAKLPPVALANTKAALNGAASTSFEQALAGEASSQQVNVSTRDTREAVQAFIEKRDADYLGY